MSTAVQVDDAPDTREVPSVVQRRVQRFAELLEAVFADRETAERLSVAGVMVQITVTDLPAPESEATFTLLLNQSPAHLTRGIGHRCPDVRLRMCSADLDAMVRDGQYLPMHILSGEVSFDGCVRKFLRVLPIMRAAAAEAATREEDGATS
jgi:hypothetical protein